MANTFFDSWYICIYENISMYIVVRLIKTKRGKNNVPNGYDQPWKLHRYENPSCAIVHGLEVAQNRKINAIL